MYSINIRSGEVRRLSDDLVVIADDRLPEWQDYEAWLKAEGTPVEIDQPPIADVKATKLSTLANRRWQATQYFQFDGVKAPADSAMQAITAVAVSVSMGLRSSTDLIVWKLTDGEFRHWSLQQLLGYANAVQAHIQTCFNHEALLSGLIQAADTIEDVESVDIETGWPT